MLLLLCLNSLLPTFTWATLVVQSHLYKLLLLPRWKMGLILQYNHVHLQLNS